MESVAHLFEIVVVSQADVYFTVISGVVTMGIRLEQGREVDGVNTQLFQMGNPILHFKDPVCRNSVIFKGSSAESQRIDLIKNTFISPHNIVNPFYCIKFLNGSVKDVKNSKSIQILLL